jgi:hypothetical protein
MRIRKKERAPDETPSADIPFKHSPNRERSMRVVGNGVFGLFELAATSRQKSY